MHASPPSMRRTHSAGDPDGPAAEIEAHDPTPWPAPEAPRGAARARALHAAMVGSRSVGFSRSPMTRCHGCRLRRAPLALQWHPRRELAARQAERGTCARPTQARAMSITHRSKCAGRAAFFMRNPTLSSRFPKKRSSLQSGPLVKGTANRRAVKKRISVATDL